MFPDAFGFFASIRTLFGPTDKCKLISIIDQGCRYLSYASPFSLMQFLCLAVDSKYSFTVIFWCFEEMIMY